MARYLVAMTEVDGHQSGVAITGGQAMARQLATEGITDIFGIPGVQLDHATNGLAGYRDRIRFFTVRHEQTATYAADGYARTTGRVGTALVVPGPGVLNAGAGLVTALACSSRVLLLAGQLPSPTIGKGWGMLHEISDQSGILERLCRSSTLVTDPGEVAGALHGAMVRLGQGPGPVAVELPPDVLAGSTDGPPVGPEPAAPAPPGPEADLGAAAELLAGAERPVILAGGGAAAAGAWDELAELSRALGAPLVSTVNGRGAFDDRLPMAFDPMAGREVLYRADVVVMLGSRGMDFVGRPHHLAPEATVISVNIDPVAFTGSLDLAVTVLGDARAAAAALAELVADRHGGEGPSWLADADDVRARAAAELAVLEPQLSYLRALRTALPDDGVLVNEYTQVGYVARSAFPVHHPRSFVDPGYQGTLGYGFPTAIGAAVGNPDRPVVSITGDGGFGYGLAELATLAHYDIPLVVVVFNDGAFGNVQRMHRQQFDGDHFGTELSNPDFGALAAAFGVDGHRAEGPEALQQVLSRAIDARRPALIEVPMPEVPDPWAVTRKRWFPK
jgi:acetolactate synthase-1/2/3 large subunit